MDFVERNFWGEKEVATPALHGNPQVLTPGLYRVIDGTLCRILDGLSRDEVKERLGAPTQL